jgi:copper(I)-binding protein
VRAARARGLLALFLTVAVSLAAAAACGDDSGGDENGEHTATGEVVATAGDIEIIEPYARETVNDVAAVYMTLQSTGLEDTLVAAEASVGTAWEVHEVVEEGGSGSMRPVEGGLVIPAGGHVHLEPGSYHLMLMGLAEPLAPGDELEVELTFASGAVASFSVPVLAVGDEGDDHDEHE